MWTKDRTQHTTWLLVPIREHCNSFVVQVKWQTTKRSLQVWAVSQMESGSYNAKLNWWLTTPQIWMALQQESTRNWKQTYKGGTTIKKADKHTSTQQYFSSPKNGCSQQLEQQTEFVQITCGAIKYKAWEFVKSHILQHQLKAHMNWCLWWNRNGFPSQNFNFTIVCVDHGEDRKCCYILDSE